MPNIGDLIGSFKDPITGILTAANDLIGRFVTDPTQKLQAQLELARLQTDATLKLADLDVQFATQQAAVIQTEAKSESWMTRNWRPVLMLTFTFIIAWNYIIVPIVGAFTPNLHPAVLTQDMWDLLKIGVGGYIASRGIEKGIDKWTDGQARIQVAASK